MKDVALLAVDVVQQGDAGAAVRVVLDGRDLRGDAVLVALEVDDAVLALVSAALVTGGDTSMDVTTTGLGEGTNQRLFRIRAGNLGKVRDARTATTGGRRLVLTNSH